MEEHAGHCPWHAPGIAPCITGLPPLTPEAADMAIAFERTLEPLLAEGQELHSIRDWAGKLPSRVVRMAALLHMFRDGWETTSAVGADCMEASTEMAVALIEHTKVVFSLLVGTNEQAEAARHILGRIVQRGCTLFTARDVLRWTHGRTGLETMATVRSGLDILVECGHVAPHEGIEPRWAGRPTEAYHVNPKVFLRRR
jgi:hypothetical protein